MIRAVIDNVVGDFDAAQSAKPGVTDAHEMNNLISNRSMSIVHRLRELLSSDSGAI